MSDEGFEQCSNLRSDSRDAHGPDQALGAGSYAGGLASGQPILKVHIQELRDRILAAWQSGGGGVNIRWLVADQLGTPRMIFDQSGSLATTSRHDYLPFGEELFAGTGGRTTAQGYSTGDEVRQHFTGYERDDETGLDFAKARYFGNSIGRFSSPDPLMASGKPWIPQSWNRYTYCLNNPLKFSDPTGLMWVYHWLNKDHTQIGFGWVDGEKTPKGYQALPFGSSGVAVLTLSGGRQLAILHSDSRLAQLVSVTNASRASNSDTVPNPSLVSEFSRRTGPMPAATGTFVGLSVMGGVLAASSPLNAAAYLAYALHERARDDAQITAGTRAPEYPAGQLPEGRFPDAALKYLGPGYKEMSPGRYISADGMRQVRFGAHETSGDLHAHFEAFDKPGGRIIENSPVELVP